MPDSVKKEYTGIYKFRKEDSVQVVVSITGPGLLVNIPGQAAFEILPVNKNQFKAGDARVEFMRNNNGRIEQLFIYKDGEIAGVGKVE